MDGSAFQFVKEKCDKKRKAQAQLDENKAKNAKQRVEAVEARRAVGEPVTEEIKNQNVLPVKLTKPQLEGVAELLGCYEDVKSLKVAEIRDRVAAEARVKGWLRWVSC